MNLKYYLNCLYYWVNGSYKVKIVSVPLHISFVVRDWLESLKWFKKPFIFVYCIQISVLFFTFVKRLIMKKLNKLKNKLIII